MMDAGSPVGQGPDDSEPPEGALDELAGCALLSRLCLSGRLSWWVPRSSRFVRATRCRNRLTSRRHWRGRLQPSPPSHHLPRRQRPSRPPSPVLLHRCLRWILPIAPSWNRRLESISALPAILGLSGTVEQPEGPRRGGRPSLPPRDLLEQQGARSYNQTGIVRTSTTVSSGQAQALSSGIRTRHTTCIV